MNGQSMFDRAFELVVGIEAGYVNDPKDPGRETKFGISKRAYPSLDIAQLTIEQAKEIYQRDYWTKSHCEGQTWPWALAIFDCAVNQGLQTALHLLAQFQGNLIEFLAERGVRYAEDKRFDRFGRGWMRRLINITIESQKVIQ